MSCIMPVNIDKAKEHVAKINEKEQKRELKAGEARIKYKLTHYFGWVTAQGMYRIRRDLGKLSFGGFKHDKSYGITLLVNIEGGSDLVPATIWDGHKMTFEEFSGKIQEKIERARSKKDKVHEQKT